MDGRIDFTTLKLPGPVMPTKAELEEAASLWWEVGGPTFHDGWPEALRALSSPTVSVPLDAEAVEALVAPMDGTDTVAAEERRAALAAALDGFIGGRRTFVKLNSRSPKDFTGGLPTFAMDGAQAVELLCSSMRTVEDMLHFRHLPPEKAARVLLREDSRYLRESEVRAFVFGGRLQAASVYHHLDAGVVAAWNGAAGPLDGEEALDFVRDAVMPACHLRTFVADVAYSERRGAWELIEINPWGGSDPCAFGDYVTLGRWTALHGRPSVVARLPGGFGA